jgi:hypothetical protein
VYDLLSAKLLPLSMMAPLESTTSHDVSWLKNGKMDDRISEIMMAEIGSHVAVGAFDKTQRKTS